MTSRLTATPTDASVSLAPPARAGPTRRSRSPPRSAGVKSVHVDLDGPTPPPRGRKEGRDLFTAGRSPTGVS
ncbi:hypothetical protein NL676_014526 [Syzygium grande]|nr:hypothetical protein NL676_014526 [Syzygium grande]